MTRVRSIHDLASAARGRRLDLHLSQAEVAARAGVSRKWIHEFERGKPTAEFGLVLKVLDALDLSLDLPRTEPLEMQDNLRTLDEILAELENQRPGRG